MPVGAVIVCISVGIAALFFSGWWERAHWSLVTISVGSGGSLISSGGFDHGTLEACKAEFENLRRDSSPGLPSHAYCESNDGGRIYLAWPGLPADAPGKL